MTPNKLPPLPKPSCDWSPETHVYSGADLHAYAAEALRQSQSLPAGAVARGEHWFAFDGNSFDTFGSNEDARKAADEALSYYRDDAPDGWNDDVQNICYGVIVGRVVETENRPAEPDDGMDPVIDTFVDYGLQEYAALQADAREKGEIADLESDIDTLVDHNMALQSAIRDAIKIHSSFGTTADMADWLRDELDALATQPAQASEKDGCVSVPRDALLTEARRLRYRATEAYGLGPARTDAGAQMIHTAEALEGFASSGKGKE